MTKQALILDAKRIKQALAACKTDRDRVMFLLSVKAGLRAIEIAAIRWEQIDLGGNMLLLKTTKGDKPRNVPLNADLKAALSDYKQDNEDGWLFENQQSRPGQCATRESVAVWFGDLYRRKLGWSGYSSHSGRRTFVTNAAKKITEAGGTLKDIQTMAGHADLKTTSRYIEIDEDAQRKVVDMI